MALFIASVEQLIMLALQVRYSIFLYEDIG